MVFLLQGNALQVKGALLGKAPFTCNALPVSSNSFLSSLGLSFSLTVPSLRMGSRTLTTDVTQGWDGHRKAKTQGG